MRSELSERSRQEYRQFFVAYHDRVAQSGFTGRRVKPLSVLPASLLRGFEEALLARVPSAGYLLMPTLRTRLKMGALGLLPAAWAQALLHRRFVFTVECYIFSDPSPS